MDFILISTKNILLEAQNCDTSIIILQTSMQCTMRQQNISQNLNSNISVVLSAPTSFGKSLLIEEIVASRKHRNIVVVQPTLALLDETRKKYKKYEVYYNIIVSTSKEPSENNIFLFTAERVIEYTQFSSIDFFVIDEFYKLSLDRDDDRAIALNAALYKLLKYTKYFYLLGPEVNNIPIQFKSKYEFLWVKSNFTTVSVNNFKIDYKNKEEKPAILYELLLSLKEPVLIYCSSPEKATNLAINFYFYCLNKNKNLIETNENDSLCEWVIENIHKKWSLSILFKYKIGIHHGAIPRHLGSSIVDNFNDRKLNFLFCTSTLIEGVNTSAKNIVLFDKTKGPIPIDYFDFKNISGRAGRFIQYFTGNVYNFENEPEQLEFNIDIPIITQENAPDEILINIDDADLTSNSLEKIQYIKKFEVEFQNILKKHCSLPLDGLIHIQSFFEKKKSSINENLLWTGYPKYNELLPIIELAWNYLLRKKETKAGVRSYKQLTTLTIQYGIYKNIADIIKNQFAQDYWIKTEPDEQKRINKLSYFILNIQRHWFDYKLPKLLIAISDIQEYVFTKNGFKKGDYKYFPA